MDSFRPTTPFRQTTNHIPRTKAPAPLRAKGSSTPEPPRRSRTPTPYEEDGRPWQQMVNTYEWVMVQEYLEIRRNDRPLGRSASIGQHAIDMDWKGRPSDEARRRYLEEKAYDIDMQARMWMAQEEARRLAALREAEKTRLVQEEVRRIQARVRQRRESERHKMMEERHRAQEEAKERTRRQRQSEEKAVTSAWRTYESRWATLSTSSEQLTFRTIPWPTISPPSTPSSITLQGIAFFLLSPLHSETKSPKDRIKEALRRWHPDRFHRLMSRVPEKEKALVEEGVGIVTRGLNELLSRQGNGSTPVCLSLLSSTEVGANH